MPARGISRHRVEVRGGRSSGSANRGRDQPQIPDENICFILDTRPGCSKLMKSLVNDSLKFLMLISKFLNILCRKHVTSFSNFFQQKNLVYLVIQSLNTL